MAVEKTWIKYTVIAMCVSLFLLTLAQLGLAGAFAVYLYLPTMNFLVGVSVSADALVAVVAAYYIPWSELGGSALFVMPAIWLGFAAATSRHRGVYIMATVLCCLALLDAIGFIIYEAWVFTVIGILEDSSSILRGIAITKLVLWALILLFLVINVCVVIAATCTRSRPRYRGGNYYHGPMIANPDDYQFREHQPKYLTATPPTPARYFDYGYPSPRNYYK